MSESVYGKEQREALERKIEERDRQIKETLQYNEMLRDGFTRAQAQLNSLSMLPALSGHRSMAMAALDVAYSRVTSESVKRYHEDTDRLDQLMRIVYHCVKLEDVEKLNDEYMLNLDASLIEKIQKHPMMEVFEDIELIRLLDNGLPYKSARERVIEYMEQRPKEQSVSSDEDI